MLRIRRRNEEYIRKVVRHFHIMIDKRIVLLGVEHFKQRRRRIAPEIHRHLINFVQKEYRIYCSCLFHHLDDAARQRPDIGSSMAPNLGLIANAAKGHSHELASERMRNGHAQRRFTDTRRAGKAQDRTLYLFRKMPYGNKFNDTLLYLFQTIMVFVEDIHRMLNVPVVGCLFLPRNIAKPFDICPHHRRFRGKRRHFFQTLDLLQRLRFGFFAHLHFFDGFLQFLDFIHTVVTLTELFLDDFHLLVQVVLFLRLFHLLADLALYLLFNIHDIDLAVYKLDYFFEPLFRIADFKQRLFQLKPCIDVRRDYVGKVRYVVNAADRRQRLGRHFFIQLNIFFEVFYYCLSQRHYFFVTINGSFDILYRHFKRFAGFFV